MPEMRVELLVNPTQRESTCVLCGKSFDQHYVTLGLFADGRRLGDLDPRCLAAGPPGAAERARRHAAKLQEVAEAIARLGQWSVAMGQVQEAERRELTMRFPSLTPEDLRKLVEDRYREVLSDDNES